MHRAAAGVQILGTPYPLGHGASRGLRGRSNRVALMVLTTKLEFICDVYGHERSLNASNPDNIKRITVVSQIMQIMAKPILGARV